MEKMKRLGIGAGLGTALTMVGFMLAGPASADTADPGKKAIEGMGDKITTYGGAMLLVVVIGIGILLAAKYLRRTVSQS